MAMIHGKSVRGGIMGIYAAEVKASLEWRVKVVKEGK
jgi:hypothetical protein